MKRFLNIKGMLLIVYATANYYSALVSTLEVFILSLDTLLNSFKTGAIILQGPHQFA